MNESNLAPAIPQLPSGDLEKTADFFETKLGFTIVSKMLDYNFLSVKRGSAEIHFWKASSDEEARNFGGAIS